jgi:hypothetical protein
MPVPVSMQIKEQSMIPDLTGRPCSRQVYDVTAFMEEHPGGDEVLLACTGNPSSPSTSPHANEVVGGS